MNLESGPMENTDHSSLEGAIREEAQRVLASMALKETQEIKSLEEVHAQELEDFRKQAEVSADVRLKQETSRSENRASLELKKYKLKRLEAFVTRTVEEAAQGIRNHPGYKKFLLDSIALALGSVSLRAEIRLQSEDLAWEKEIRETAAFLGREVMLVPDPTLKWGGCRVVDADRGWIFDSSLERIYFRKSALLRSEALKILEDSEERGQS